MGQENFMFLFRRKNSITYKLRNMEEGWKTVFETDQEYQATIARDILENNNIQAVILNQKDSTYLVLGHILVLVPESEEGTATNLLKELKN